MDLYNIELEKKVLSILKESPESFDKIDLTTEDFSIQYGYIYELFLKIYEEHNKIDEIMCNQYIQEKKSKSRISLIADLNDGFGDIGYYTEQLKKQTFKRNVLTFSENIKIAAVKNNFDDLDKMYTELFLKKEKSYHTLSDIMKTAVEKIEEYCKRKDISGITTGFSSLNYYLDGFQDGNLIILGARPSRGKTALALNMASSAFKKQKKVGFFSAEMEKYQILFRLLACEGKFDLLSIRRGLRENDFKKLVSASSRFYSDNFIINDTPNINIFDLKSQARRMKREDVQIIFIDYLTLITYNKTSFSTVERIGAISKELKGLARNLNIPIVCLSQLGRDSEDKTPTMADLRWSGEIEQDADVILLIDKKKSENDCRLLIEKQRNGPTGIIDMYFNPKYTLFREKERG